MISSLKERVDFRLATERWDNNESYTESNNTDALKEAVHSQLLHCCFK